MSNQLNNTATLSSTPPTFYDPVVLGHTLDVNQNVYTQSPVEIRQAAVNQLEKSLQVM